MRKIRDTFLIVVICLPLIQCTAESDPKTEEYGRSFQAVEELRIGVLDGEPEYIFGRIRDVAFGGEGKIVVADIAVPIIRIYNENGVFVSNAGRSGRGPGEYQLILGMKTFADGKITVWDPRNMYVHLYEADGEFIESHDVQANLFGGGVFEAGLDGNYYVRNTLDTTVPNWKFAWLRISPEGVLTDTIREPYDSEVRPSAFILSTATGSHYPFLERNITVLGKWGEMITGRTTEYKLTIHKDDAEPVIISREYEPVELSDEEWQQWERIRRQFGSDIRIPRIKPAFNQIFSDSDGRIWVQRYVEASLREVYLGVPSRPSSRLWEKPVFDVFMPDGRFYGTVELPDNAKFEDAKGDQVLALVTGEMGEVYVSRFRLEPVVVEPEV
jgi:hypothetical protein